MYVKVIVQVEPAEQFGVGLEETPCADSTVESPNKGNNAQNNESDNHELNRFVTD